MDIIKKISVGSCVNFYKLHRADERDSLFYNEKRDSLFYNEKCITEGETLWRFYDYGFRDDDEPDLVFDNDRRINGAQSYLRFEPGDLA